jgi:phenylacetaldehyde dehydrogenase
MGPLVSRKQADRVAAYLDGARQEGASVLTGGGQLGEAGAFIEPAVVVGCAAGSAIVREEVFGPVLVAEPFDELSDVVAAANDSDYGLAASIWTQGLSEAHRLSRQIKAGTVWINCHSMYDASLPIGGVKQSGWGRDSGQPALEAYLEWKTVCAVL